MRNPTNSPNCFRRLWLLLLIAWAFVSPLDQAHADQASGPALETGFDPSQLARIDEEIERAIDERKLPGAVVWLEHKGRSFQKAYGARALQPRREAMTEDTIFDAASLTKVLVTAPALLILHERGKLNIDSPVATVLDEFKDGGKESITFVQLLTHTSGLNIALRRSPDWGKFGKALESIRTERPRDPPGTRFRYSDINFIVLGEVVRRVSGTTLDQFANEHIFGPLQMRETRFVPPSDWIPRIAPTEKSGEAFLRGQVHDPKALRMGGVAGHAGVFTTAPDLARFARMMLNHGELDGTRILSAESVRRMTSVQSSPAAQVRRGLGWDIDSEYSRPRGSIFPLGSYGHTGFTGVSLWIDPFSQTFWILLTNRVHPYGTGDIRSLQRTLGTLAAEAIRDFDFQHVTGALPPREAGKSAP
ncbi:MAG: serine hydrolase domain-containing protein [Verrucomicrobiota bacterium]